MKAQSVLFWFTVVHSKCKFFTSINFHDDVSFGMMTEKLKSILAQLEPAKYLPISSLPVGFYVSEMCSQTN